MCKRIRLACRSQKLRSNGLWRHIKLNNVKHGMYRSIITTGQARTAGGI